MNNEQNEQIKNATRFTTYSILPINKINKPI